MSQITRFLLTCSIVFVSTLILTDQAQAQAASGCVSGSWVNVAGNGVQTTLNVTNKTSCGAKQVSLCSYRVYIRPNNAGWLSTQTLFDSQVITLQPGQTVTMAVDTDTCMNQVDAYEGPCVYPFVSDNTAVPYIFAGRMTDFTDILCVNCTNECTVVGQKECSGNGYRQCEKGAGGCLKWGTVTNCAVSEICSGGICIPSCTDECSVMDQRVCSGNGWKQCGNYDSDSCKEWGTITNCASDEICNNGSCVKTCADECTLNQHQCSGSSGRTCGIFGGTCTSWGTYQLCDTRCYTCGDNRCDCGETRSTCPQDCGYNTPTVDLRSSGSVACNQTATLTWSSTNADSCTASGSWSGSKTTNGSESVGNFTGSRVFTLTCSNSGGSAADSVTLTGSSDELEVSAGSDKEVYDSNSVRLNGSVEGDYDHLSWSCTGGILSDNDVEDPTWRATAYAYDSDGFGDGYNYDRTYTCTLTARNECGSDSDSMTIRARRQNEPANFNVSLVTRPQSECAPLDGVDLTATVSNYGTYDYNSSNNSNYGFTYYFDCENDGSWDKTVTSNDTTYTAYDVCDYRNVGNYTAKVRVDSRGRTATDTQIVTARNCQTPIQVGRVNIQKLVRNLTDGTAYQASVTANPAEVVSYKIILTGVEGTTDNISVIDVMPANIVNVRDLLVDGIATGGDLSSGINVGNLTQGQTKIITFNATVAGEASFIYGQTALTNAATVNTSGGSASARATVYVYRTAVQGATTISTGFDANMFAGFGMAIAGALIVLYFMARQVLTRKKLGAAETLARKIALIKRNDLA
ncbi:MAG: hypothetical protein WCX69_01155 [Candidatus Paceibacterota bacterium]